jgi:hypothetical protein
MVSQRVEPERTFGLSRDDYRQTFQIIIGEKHNKDIQSSRYLPFDMTNVDKKLSVLNVSGKTPKNGAQASGYLPFDMTNVLRKPLVQNDGGE